jgi:hypothetical protein
MLRIRWVKPFESGNSEDWPELRGVAERDPPEPRMYRTADPQSRILMREIGVAGGLGDCAS